MNHIVVDYHPFLLEQDIYVYVNGECVKQAKVQLDRVIDVVRGFRNTYNIDRIDMCGGTAYLTKFAEQMKTEYSDDKCVITITNK